MPRILLVEDNADHANLTLRALRKVPGWEVEIARYAGEALRLLRTKTIDIVLLDYRLPDRSGLDLLEDVVKEVPDAQVILMTAQGSEEVAERALDLGAAAYIVKDASLARRVVYEVERLVAAKEE